jgi:hypothetical protein
MASPDGARPHARREFAPITHFRRQFRGIFTRPIAATLIAVSVVLLLLIMLMKKPAFDVSDCETAAFRMHKGVARASCLSFTRVAPI